MNSGKLIPANAENDHCGIRFGRSSNPEKCLYTVKRPQTLVHPREVFADSLTHRAAALVVAHSHPSGKGEASPEDREVTKRIMMAGEPLGVRFLDHAILSIEEYFSSLEHGEV